jgi:hypothetical protein
MTLFKSLYTSVGEMGQNTSGVFGQSLGWAGGASVYSEAHRSFSRWSASPACPKKMGLISVFIPSQLRGGENQAQLSVSVPAAVGDCPEEHFLLLSSLSLPPCLSTSPSPSSEGYRDLST